MKLNTEQLNTLCGMAIEAALSAGKLISAYSGKDFKTEKKAGGDSEASQVVTEVDFESQEVILKTLLPTIKTYDLALLTEEGTDDKSRLEKDYFWCIDPLDGTLPFTKGLAGYSVSIALISKFGEPFLGVVYDPVNKNLYHAVHGQGAFRNLIPWNLKQTHKNELTFYYNRSFNKLEVFEDVLLKLKSMALDMQLEGLKIGQLGGAAMNACWLLENAPACFFALPKKTEGGGSLWDYAAVACIYKEIGAEATDIYGQPLDLNRTESTFLNHKGILFSSQKSISERITEFCQDLINQ
jgi:fructose-1,6-bisphosphatase/inositol monophosphatase family enzyme